MGYRTLRQLGGGGFYSEWHSLSLGDECYGMDIDFVDYREDTDGTTYIAAFIEVKNADSKYPKARAIGARQAKGIQAIAALCPSVPYFRVDYRLVGADNRDDLNALIAKIRNVKNSPQARFDAKGDLDALEDAVWNWHCEHTQFHISALNNAAWQTAENYGLLLGEWLPHLEWQDVLVNL